MKRLPFPIGIFLFVLLISTFGSCKKNDHDDPKPVGETVEIAGEKYSIVKIGSQTWTAANYRGAGGVNYDNANSKPEYGKYYSYNEAKAIQVPSGWRLPSIDDFIKLAQSQGIVIENFRATKQDGIKKITSINNWLHINGNNQSGFNAFPAGYIYKTTAPMDGDISEFWTIEKFTFSIQESADQKNHNILVYDNSTVDDFKFNVRFVRDN